MHRTSITTLRALALELNCLTKSPVTYFQAGYQALTNVGHWRIDEGHGGVCLERVTNETGGVSCPLWLGNIPKLDAYNRIRAFIAGIRFERRV